MCFLDSSTRPTQGTKRQSEHVIPRNQPQALTTCLQFLSCTLGLPIRPDLASFHLPWVPQFTVLGSICYKSPPLKSDTLYQENLREPPPVPGSVSVLLHSLRHSTGQTTAPSTDNRLHQDKDIDSNGTWNGEVFKNTPDYNFCKHIALSFLKVKLQAERAPGSLFGRVYCVMWCSLRDAVGKAWCHTSLINELRISNDLCHPFSSSKLQTWFT